MKLSRLSVLVLTFSLIVISLSPSPTLANGLSVTFNKTYYDVGDTVYLKVCYSSTAPIAIEVWGPSGNLVWMHEDPSYTPPCKSYVFTLPSTSPEGNYTVYVAASGSTPRKFTFQVLRSRFKIVKYTSSITGLPGGAGLVTVDVKDEGAGGLCIVRLLDNKNNVVAQQTLNISALSTASTKLVFNLPSTIGVYTYKLETYNVRHGTVDDVKSVTVKVVSGTTTVTVTSTPPPPPPIMTTTPTTTTTTMTMPSITPTTTTPVIPGGVVTYVANISNVTNVFGVVYQSVAVSVPKYNVKIEISKGTKLTKEGKPVTALVITVVTTKPPAPVTQKPVGTIVDIGPSGTVFSKPVKIQVPFNPAAVPPGYSVFLAYYDDSKKAWVPLPTLVVDRVRGIVIGETTHLTLFAAVSFRVATPVTLTTTVVSPTTVTTSLTTTTATTTVTTVTSLSTTTVTATSPATVTVTSTKTSVVTKPVTITATPTTVSVTKTLTTTRTVVAPSTVMKTTTVTKKIPAVPGWVYPTVSVLAALIVVAVVVSYLIWGRRRKST